MSSKIKLDLFAVVWNQMQNQTTPAIHLRILRWLESAWQNQDLRLLLMAFRSCGKSTLVGIFCAWLIHQNPNKRILILAADDALARKMVRNVKRIIERHPLTVGLKPAHMDQWANDRFTVRRSLELRDPTILARGISSNITGARADIIIYDDVEVPNTCGTKEARTELRNRLDESRFILTPQGTQLYVGTPHTFETIYQTQDEENKEAFLRGFKKLKLPIIGEKGQSIWPERFLLSDIQAMERQVGPNKFSSQMMLQPVNINEGRLNVDSLRFYEGELDYREVVQKPTLFLNEKQIVSCSSWWDPAFGSASGDASVWALVFTDIDGHYYLHHIEYIRVSDNNIEDEATQQCRKIAVLIGQYHVPSVTVEINGLGRFLPAILRREISALNIHCSVIEHSSRIAKAVRILESFDVVMAAQALSVHIRVKQSPFLSEMREWRPSTTKGRDDGLDAVAGALSQEPIRISSGQYRSRKRSWHPNAKIFKAKT
jgi:hypothetical protein